MPVIAAERKEYMRDYYLRHQGRLKAYWTDDLGTLQKAIAYLERA